MPKAMHKSDAMIQAADREARNEYLTIIDEAWEVCAHAVEAAREAYEETLEKGRMALESALSAAGTAHGRGVDQAWSEYKEVVANTPLATRRNMIAEARSVYNEQAAKVRVEYETAKEGAQKIYAQMVQDARAAFEAALENEFQAHREAVRVAGKYLETGESSHVDYVGPTSPMAVQEDETSVSDPHDVDEMAEAALAAFASLDEEGDVILEGINPE